MTVLEFSIVFNLNLVTILYNGLISEIAVSTTFTQSMERTFRHNMDDTKFDVSALLLVKVPCSSTLVRGHLPKVTTN